MKLEFNLNKDEVWAACSDMYCGASYLNGEKSFIFLYNLSWGLFWLAVLVSLTIAFGDYNLLFKSYISEALLGSAFVAFYFFNKYATKFGPKRFKSLEKGNQGEHEVELGGETVLFSTPSGKIEVRYTDITAIIAINEHLLIYTAIWGCYVPLEKFERKVINEAAKVLQERTSLTLINRIKKE